MSDVTPEEARKTVRHLRNLTKGYGDAKFAVSWIQENRCDLANALDSLAAQLEAAQRELGEAQAGIEARDRVIEQLKEG